MTETFLLADQYILFFDFLGTSAAAKSWPPDEVAEFIQLLRWIADQRMRTSITGGSNEDGSYCLQVTPEISTFSDHVVLSYDGAGGSEENSAYWQSVWTELVFMDCIRILSIVAEAANSIGLLVRGGLSYGLLYHHDGVVFGEAMVDAAELEKNAKLPKIAISPRVIDKLTHEKAENLRRLLLKDVDGWYLNYYRHMVERAVQPCEGAFDKAMAWRKDRLLLIDENIMLLPAYRDPWVKWNWFRQQFVCETARFGETDTRASPPLEWQPQNDA